MPHPSRQIFCELGEELLGKKIIYCVTGSIANVEAVKVIRELIRYGAEVKVFCSKNALKFVTRDSLEFASGSEVIEDLSGETEHITYVKDADLVLVCPASADIISKAAYGICDCPASTAILVALGAGKKILMVPAMDLSMYTSKVIQENVRKLKKLGVKFLGPKISEGKAKMPGKEEIVANVIRELWKGDFKGKKVLILSGATYEPIDSVRVITNLSSGLMGYCLAREAFLRGAEVRTILGLGKSPEHFSEVTRVGTCEEMLYHATTTISKWKPDVVISVAAISDYRPERFKGKIPSGQEELILKLKPTPKVISEIRKKYKGILVIFKADETKDLLEKAKKRKEEVKAQIVVANPITAFSAEETEAWIISDFGERKVKGKKWEIAREIFDEISKFF